MFCQLIHISHHCECVVNPCDICAGGLFDFTCVNIADGSWTGRADHVSRVGGEVLGASQ